MAQDITEQANQDAIADSLVAKPEESQEPQEPTGTEETVEETEPPAEQAEEQVEEEADYLPTEQEKVFPDEVLAKYAQRYGIDFAKADPQTRQLVIDKINSDIYVRQLREQAEQEPEQVIEEPESEPEPTPQPQITREQYFTSLRQAVAQKTDPQVAKELFIGFNKAFGVPDDQTQALLTQNPNAAMDFTQTLSWGALNLINTFLPDILGANIQSYVEQAYPEFGQMYSRAQAANTWDSVRNQLGNAELPAYGTKEFASAARQIGADIAGSPERFEKMVFADAHGKPLSPAQNLAEKHRMIAERMANGGQEKVTPALVAQAVQTGQKLAQRAQVKKSAGNLSSGKSKGQIAQQTNDDDIFGEGYELYKIRQGTL